MVKKVNLKCLSGKCKINPAKKSVRVNCMICDKKFITRWSLTAYDRGICPNCTKSHQVKIIRYRDDIVIKTKEVKQDD